MPYYVYSMKPAAQLSLLAEFAGFAAASAHAKALRAALAPATLERVKVIFAEHPLQAEDLLLQVRDPGPAGDD